MSKYIYSTGTNDMIYLVREKSAGGVSITKDGVLIKGGASLADKKTLITPKGVLTVLEDKDYDKIKDDVSFKRHISRGFIKVEAKKVEIEKAIEGMKEDNSKPLDDKKIEAKTKATVKK